MRGCVSSTVRPRPGTQVPQAASNGWTHRKKKIEPHARVLPKLLPLNPKRKRQPLRRPPTDYGNKKNACPRRVCPSHDTKILAGFQDCPSPWPVRPRNGWEDRRKQKIRSEKTSWPSGDFELHCGCSSKNITPVSQAIKKLRWHGFPHSGHMREPRCTDTEHHFSPATV